MAKHEVTGQAQPATGIPADQVKQHPSIPDMPLAPGSRYVEPGQKTATGQSNVSVSNKPTDDGGIPASMPVSAASQYVPPPDRVTSPNTNQEPSR